MCLDVITSLSAAATAGDSDSRNEGKRQTGRYLSSIHGKRGGGAVLQRTRVDMARERAKIKQMNTEGVGG